MGSRVRAVETVQVRIDRSVHRKMKTVADNNQIDLSRLLSDVLRAWHDWGEVYCIASPRPPPKKSGK